MLIFLMKINLAMVVPVYIISENALVQSALRITF
jgi:hypothetical protein